MKAGTMALVASLVLAQGTGRAIGQIRFQDVTLAAGLERIGGVSGVSFLDFNGDGWDDLTFAAVDGQVRLWANQQDGTFQDVTPAGGLPGGGPRAFVLWFDHDGDAFPDLLVGGAHTVLYRNTGTGASSNPTLEDRTATAGLTAPGTSATAAISDVDGDGELDLFVTFPHLPDRLYISDGSGSYREEAAERGVVDRPSSFPMQAVFMDVDDDGDPDLYALYDGQERSRLFVNDGTGVFTELAVPRGLSYIGPGNTMGLAVGDVNEDGIPDFNVTRIGRGGLFVSNMVNGEPTWSDVAVEWGADRNGMSWGTVFMDADADGDLDLAVVNISGYDGTPSLFFERTGPATFVEQGLTVGFAALSQSYGLAQGDINNDGLPDLIVPDVTGRHRLLLNVSESVGHRVGMVLDGPPGNRSGVGARARLYAGGHLWTQWQLAGDSYTSQQSSRLLFGLGDAGADFSFDVLWPDGEVSTGSGSFPDSSPYTQVRVAHSGVVGVEAQRPRGIAQEDKDLGAVHDTGLQVWPNPVPANGRIFVQGPEQAISLFDVLGRQIWQGRSGEVDLSRLDLSPGVHVLRASSYSGGSAKVLVVSPRR